MRSVLKQVAAGAKGSGLLSDNRIGGLCATVVQLSKSQHAWQMHGMIRTSGSSF